MQRQPPNPAQFRSIMDWARQFYEYTLAQTLVTQKQDPQPVLLAHKITGDERAAADGIFMFDPVQKTPVVSIDGVWYPTRSTPMFEAHYHTAFNADGASIGTGGVAIPFNSLLVDIAPWATFDPTNGYFDLDQGSYYIDGFVTLSKGSVSGAKSFTGYLAKTSDLTTPVGDVTMGTLVIPSSASNTSFVVPFRGQVDVDTTDTYAMVVNTSDSNVQFGIAHGISGYSNDYASIGIHKIGLNE